MKKKFRVKVTALAIYYREVEADDAIEAQSIVEVSVEDYGTRGLELFDEEDVRVEEAQEIGEIEYCSKCAAGFADFELYKVGKASLCEFCYADLVEFDSLLALNINGENKENEK